MGVTNMKNIAVFVLLLASIATLYCGCVNNNTSDSVVSDSSEVTEMTSNSSITSYVIPQSVIDELKNDPTNSHPKIKFLFNDDFPLTDFSDFKDLNDFLIKIDREVESIINQQESNSNINDIYTAVANRLFEKANTTYDIMSVKNSQMRTLAEKYKDTQQKSISELREMYANDIPETYEGSIGALICTNNEYHSSKISVITAYLFYQTYRDCIYMLEENN